MTQIVQMVHIVAWRLQGETAQQRRQQADAVVAAVEALRGRIPGLVALDVGINLVAAPEAWDVGAVMMFASRADLDAYHEHPAHLDLKRIVGPLRSARAQLDFERTVAANGDTHPKGRS
ncbi:MAG: Dabb family protein [Burkholderiales bacterium]|nr:Dabb family protein [Burkholderiales bacterium]MDE2397994.1 Dabb family protein [Burkholderiales bacterium]MDE2453664.1 Dabb family protein [Burkholderiales bacterium]